MNVKRKRYKSVAEEDGCDGGGGGGGGTVGVSCIYHNRDLLKDCHARGACAPGGFKFCRLTHYGSQPFN